MKYIARSLLVALILVVGVAQFVPRASAHIAGEDGDLVCVTATKQATDADCLGENQEHEDSSMLTNPILWSVIVAGIVLGGLYIVKKHKGKSHHPDVEATDE